MAAVVVVIGSWLLWLVLRPEQPDSPVASMLLDDQDLHDIEPGFRLRLSEAAEEPLPLPEWISPTVERMVRVPSHLRRWEASDGDRTIVAVGYRLQLPVLATVVFDELVTDVSADASDEFTIAAVPGARGFVAAPNGPGDTAREYWGMFRQGGLVFTIFVSSPNSIDARDLNLARRLMERQVAKAPQTPSTAAPPGNAELAAWFAAGTLLALLIYVGLSSLVAWMSDPLRRASPFPADHVAAPRSVDASAITLIDVTSTADRQRRATQVQLAVEVVGIAVAAPAVFPFTWPLGLVVVAISAVMAWLTTVLLIGAERRHAPTRPQRWQLPRRRRLRVAVYSAASAICVLIGLAGTLLYGVGAVVASQLLVLNSAIVGVGIVLIAAGTLLYRHTRRLAAVAAREVLRADSRPIVLYLRAFADDVLILRSARYARPLLLDRLNPRGFDRFEEVIARSLTAVGPVVAVNPPGTRLAPLGAARDTLDSDHWQPKVAQRIHDAALIVIGAAPRSPAPGLVWELSALDGQQRWPTTLLVLPPLPADELHRRWERFVPLLKDTAMAGHRLPTDPAQVLVITGSVSSGWTAITAARRDEWTYGAALVVGAGITAV